MAHALIVDDDADVVDWLQEVARMEGFTVARALSLREARIELGRQKPDVLLTDLRLPDGEGIELVRELEKPEATEVIVVTGHATVDSAVAALRAGATDYLVKPADLERVQAVCGMRRRPRPCSRRSACCVMSCAGSGASVASSAAPRGCRCCTTS